MLSGLYRVTISYYSFRLRRGFPREQWGLYRVGVLLRRHLKTFIHWVLSKTIRTVMRGRYKRHQIRQSVGEHSDVEIYDIETVQALLATAQSEAAMVELDKILAYKPQALSAFLMKAKLLLDSGDPSGALECVDRIWRSADINLSLMAAVVQIYERLVLAHYALVPFTESHGVQRASNFIIDLGQGTENTSLWLQRCEEAYATYPDHPTIMASLSRVMFAVGKESEAEDIFARRLNMHSTDASAWLDFLYCTDRPWLEVVSRDAQSHITPLLIHSEVMHEFAVRCDLEGKTLDAALFYNLSLGPRTDDTWLIQRHTSD